MSVLMPATRHRAPRGHLFAGVILSALLAAGCGASTPAAEATASTGSVAKATVAVATSGAATATAATTAAPAATSSAAAGASAGATAAATAAPADTAGSAATPAPATPGPATAAPTPAPATAPPSAPPPPPTSRTVAVTLTDSSIILSQPSAPAGTVTFVIKNAGYVTHELVVLMTSIPQDQLPVDPTNPKIVQTPGVVGQALNIAVGATATLTLTLAAGSYDLICNIANHYHDGMHVGFTVTP